jgi:hypothetical protein
MNDRNGSLRMLAVAGLAMLAACGGDGGELRDETARRRAAGVADEPASPPPATEEAPPPERLPAFVLDGPSGPAAPSAPADTPAPPPAPGAGAGAGWTAGVVDAVRTQRGAITLLDVRAGVNSGFDRVVLEFTGDAVPGHRIEYVDRPVRECGSGRTVSVAGDGWLAITLRGARAHDDAGRATVQRRNRRVDMPVLRHVVFTCDFEGVVQVVLGVGSPNEFRIGEESSPSRLVIDLRH